VWLTPLFFWGGGEGLFMLMCRLQGASRPRFREKVEGAATLTFQSKINKTYNHFNLLSSP